MSDSIVREKQTHIHVQQNKYAVLRVELFINDQSWTVVQQTEMLDSYTNAPLYSQEHEQTVQM